MRGQDRVRKGFPVWATPQIPSVLSIHYTKVLHFGMAQSEVYYNTEDEGGRVSVDVGLEHIPTHPLEFPIIPPHLRSSGEHNPNC